MDLTGDGRFTISDVWALFNLLAALLVKLFFLPANLILMGLYWMDPAIPGFFELGPTYEYTTGWGTGIISGVIWLMVYMMIEAVEAERELREEGAEEARKKEERKRRYRNGQ